MLTARRALRSDAAVIGELLAPQADSVLQRFGPASQSVPHLIESSCLAVAVVDSTDSVVGFASFTDSPLHGFTDADMQWPKWLEDNFMNHLPERTSQWMTRRLSPHNAIWMTSFVATGGMEREVADRVLQTVFSTLHCVDGILVNLPEGVGTYAPLTDMFEPVATIADVYKGPTPYVCPREFFIPALLVRKARIEDHDDLVPIFNEQSEVLTDIYGEFFLAEVIETKDEHDHALVAEVNGRAVGLMTTTDKIDTVLLADCFELEIYDNLKKWVDTAAEERQKAAEAAAREAANVPHALRRLSHVYDTLLAKDGEVTREAVADRLVEYCEKIHREIPAAEPVPEPVSRMKRMSQAGRRASIAMKRGSISLVVDMASQRRKSAAPDVATLYEKMSGAIAEFRIAGEPLFVNAKNLTARLKAFAKGLAFSVNNHIMEDKAQLNLEVSLVSYLEAAVVSKDADKLPSVIGLHRGEYMGEKVEISYDMEQARIEEARQLEKQKKEREQYRENCFSITLSCIHEAFDARSIDFLDTAFELYPDREYCLVTLPHTAEESQLLTHFSAVRPRPNNNFSHALYLLHRDSYRTPLTLEWVRMSGITPVAEVLGGMANAGVIIRQLEQCAEEFEKAEAASGHEPKWTSRLDNFGFQVTCNGQVVGVLVCEQKSDGNMDDLESSFALVDHVDIGDVRPVVAALEVSPDQDVPAPAPSHAFANLVYFVVNPLFKRQAGFLMKEALRMMDKHVLTYCAKANEPLQDVLDVFTQVRPRFTPAQPGSGILLPGKDGRDKLIRDSKGHLDGGKKLMSEKASEEPEPDEHEVQSYALHVVSRRMLSRPKITINARIVVCGASNVGLAFVESLLLLPEINFSNLVLLSRTGLPMGRASPDRASQAGSGQFLPWDLNYDYNRMQCLAMESRVRVVANTLTGLQRDQKIINLADGSDLSYDFCVLTPGLQDQTRSSVLEPTSSVDGIFSLNNEDDVVDFMAFVEQTQPAVFMVYGSSLSALCAVRGLLDIDVPPAAIVWVHPHPDDHAEWCDNDKEVLDRLLGGLHKQGIKIMHDTRLVGIKEAGGRITHAVLESLTDTGAADDDDDDEENRPAAKETVIECQALLGCNTPDVDSHIFEALTANSLVYDGRAVVDSAFRTSDPSVFAAGSFAKFSRRYGAKNLNMEHFDAKEVGQRLAESVLNYVDPALMGDSDAPATPPALGVLPKTCEGLLPGGFFYLLSKKPSFDAVKKPAVLVSQKEDSLCRMEFDDYNRLRTLSYIGASGVQSRNLRGILGLPGGYLNRLLYRYSQGEVPDLIAFLESPWVTPLFHENFPELRTELLVGVGDHVGDMTTLTNEVMGLLQERNKGKDVDTTKLSALIETMPPNVKELIQLRLLQFIEQHANHLKFLQVPSYS